MLKLMAMPGLCLSLNLNAQDLNIGTTVQPVPENHKFISPDFHIWGASVVKDYQGMYHMFYSRWKYEYMGWVTNSGIGYEVSEKAEGPYQHSNVALPARGKEFWDCTPTFLFGALGITVNGVQRGHACNLRIQLN